MLRSGVSNLMRLDKLLLSSFKFILTHGWQTCLVSFPEWFITIRKEIYVTWDEPSTLFLVGGYPSLFYMPHCSANLDPTELWSNVMDSTVTLSLTAENIRRCLRWTTSLNTQTTKKVVWLCLRNDRGNIVLNMPLCDSCSCFLDKDFTQKHIAKD